MGVEPIKTRATISRRTVWLRPRRLSKGFAAKRRLLRPREKFARYGAHFSLTRYLRASQPKRLLSALAFGSRGTALTKSSPLGLLERIKRSSIAYKAMALSLSYSSKVGAEIRLRSEVGGLPCHCSTIELFQPGAGAAIRTPITDLRSPHSSY